MQTFPTRIALDRLEGQGWSAGRRSGELKGPHGVERLEPKVMELLFLLGERPGEVVTKEELLAELWPDVVVTEDALARTVFKLRKALGDDAKAPRHVETIPKRGYRLLGVIPVETRQEEQAAFSWKPWVSLGVGILGLLVLLTSGMKRPDPEALRLAERAGDAYAQYTWEENETALAFYRKAIALQPDHALAHAGLANALVQRVVRWSGPPDDPKQTFSRLGRALESRRTLTVEAQRTLLEADQSARTAVALAPRDASCLKALGFVLSARGDLTGAASLYRQALDLDADAWGVLLNLGDLVELQGQAELALQCYEKSFAAMERVYRREAVRLKPWHARTAELIGDRHLALGRPAMAIRWYRLVLELEPFRVGVVKKLAAIGQGNLAEKEARPPG